MMECSVFAFMKYVMPKKVRQEQVAGQCKRDFKDSLCYHINANIRPIFLQVFVWHFLQICA